MSPFDRISTGEAMFVVGEDFQVLRWSRLATELLGFEEEEAVGRPCYELLVGTDARSPGICGRDCPVLTGARVNARVPDYDLLSRCADGKYKWLNMTTLILEGASNGPHARRQIMHLMRDVTDKRSVEEFARVLAETLRTSAGIPSARSDDDGESDPNSQPAMVNDVSTYNVPQLSPRELQVLRLLAHGTSTSEMAAAMGVTPVTARNHVSRLLNRLGVGTRLQAVVYGARTGLI
jgi:PAS domain S-box-containing protein